MAAKLALLWHMHQPCYYDPAAGHYRMPWVFLHAAKDYYEMLRLAEEAGARITFNMVPSLVDQLLDYAKPTVGDAFLEKLRKDPSDLDQEEAGALSTQLLMAHVENQVKRYPRFYELHRKLSAAKACGAANLSRQEWLDLEVLYLLAWTGEMTRDESPLAKALVAKGSGYSQEDKLAYLNFLHELCGRTIEAYRKAGAEGKIEISATPYYHPIVPLLIDQESAREAVPDIRLPVLEKDFGDDARWHVTEAIKRHEKAFGNKPKGFWPSEGSVSTRAATLLAQSGLSWAASDEDILAASLGHMLQGLARRDLYRPYLYSDEAGNSINLFFRDKGLSDLIGFTYSTWEPKAVAADFVAHLEEIVRNHGPDCVISVILDGENAWEHYHQNGAPFLRELYKRIGESTVINFAAFSDLCGGHNQRLAKIRAGSWIYGSFTTWMGHPEKNKAWELLERTRTSFVSVADKLDTDKRVKAWERLHAAEGSDWFWWLGDDHYTPLAGEFDELFRLQLAEVHKLMGEEPPAELRIPIKKIGKRGLLKAPKDHIRPRLDGMASSFFEWRDAGLFDLGFDAGAMHRTDRILSSLKFGTDGKKLFLSIEGARSLEGLWRQGYKLDVLEGASCSLKASIGAQTGAVLAGELAWGENIEVGIDLGLVSVDPTGRVSLAFRLMREGEVVERAPLFHMAEIPLGLLPVAGAWSV